MSSKKRVSFLYLLSVLCLMIMVLPGCRSGKQKTTVVVIQRVSPIVGIWDYQAYQMKGKSPQKLPWRIITTFHPDGKYTQDIRHTFRKISLGTWDLKGDTLHIDYTETVFTREGNVMDRFKYKTSYRVCFPASGSLVISNANMTTYYKRVR